MSEIGATIDLVTLIDLETSREEGRTFKTKIFKIRACRTPHPTVQCLLPTTCLPPTWGECHLATWEGHPTTMEECRHRTTTEVCDQPTIMGEGHHPTITGGCHPNPTTLATWEECRPNPTMLATWEECHQMLVLLLPTKMRQTHSSRIATLRTTIETWLVETLINVENLPKRVVFRPLE